MAADPGGSAGAVPPYEPSRLLRGFHRMTLAAAFARRDRFRSLTATPREFVVDHETGVLAWISRAAAPRRESVLVLVHGLSGDAESGYMRGTARKALGRGFDVVRLNLRGAGGSEHLTTSTYHGGLTTDLAAVVRALIDDGHRELHLAGFSLGGNMVLRLAAEWGPDAPTAVASVAAVSPSVDLAACALRIDRSPSLAPYRRAFLADLGRLVRRMAARQPERYDPARLAGVRKLRDFDARFIAPVHGFADADDYYARASARPLLDRVAVPTLVVHARDDRLVPAEALADARIRDNGAIRVELSEHGGHCAFIGRSAPPGDEDRFWAENRLVRWALEHGRRGTEERGDGHPEAP